MRRSLSQDDIQDVAAQRRLHQQRPRQRGVNNKAEETGFIVLEGIGQQRTPQRAGISALLERDDLAA
jgi:hypothetical protein